MRYRSNKTADEHETYVTIRNRVNAKIRKIKKEHWEKFTKDIEYDFYGSQKRVWKMLRSSKKQVNEYREINPLEIDRCIDYFKQMYNNEENIPMQKTETRGPDWVITEDQIIGAIKRLKNRKAPGTNTISNEQIKYGGHTLIKEITKLFNKIIEEETIPNEWKTSITILIFKKGDKKNPANYRGISLLDTIMKLFTGIIADSICDLVPINEQQQGFRKKRSTTDAIYVIRQIIEKAIEFNNPVFMCFVDLIKAFDKIKLSDVTNILKEPNVPLKIIRLIEELNIETFTKIRTGGKLTENIPVNTGVKQGDSLSPTLFNLVMNKIIESVKFMEGYKLGNHNFNIVCYADDAVLIADNEDNLQRTLHKFNNAAEEYNMTISVEKTKCLTASKEPVRCKLEINRKIIEQTTTFNYLGVTVTSDRIIHKEVQNQVKKAATVSGALRNIIWKNKYLRTECKTRIYKTCVRPILTYAIETRADNSKTKQSLRTSEMKVLRTIVGKTRLDRIRNQNIREQCQTQDIVRWGRERRRQWNQHISRMGNERIVKAAREGKPEGSRPPGRPPKRWRDSWSSTSQEQRT